MPQAKQTKPYYTFVEGLNTEVSPLVYPDNTAADMSNMVLDVDGSISRRKGLTPETGAAFKALHTSYADGVDAVTTHFWRNPAGRDTHFHIVQAGHYLYFYIDDEDLLVARDDRVDLRAFLVSSSPATDADIAAEPVDISWGRGQALVSHPFLDSFYLRYDPTTDEIAAVSISIKIRDFVGSDDGLEATTEPTTLSAEHEYNLLNAGWNSTDIASYFSTHSKYPSNNMIHWRGYTRAETSGNTYDADGQRTWSAAKLRAEGWANAPAPRGRFVISPFDESAAASEDGVAISTWSIASTSGGSTTVTVTTDVAHGLSVSDEVNISGQKSTFNFDYEPLPGGGSYIILNWSFDGNYTISGATSNTFDITVSFPPGFNGWVDQYLTLGTATGTVLGSGELTVARPTTNAYFAGRAWYAGTPSGTLGQSVLFSQIIQKDSQYGQCYQEADPTSEFIPDLIESDGGVIYIPEAGRVTKLQPFGPSMLVMCENGIWEIDGGGNRYFDALDYTVRRVSEVGCVSKEAVIEAEDSVIFASDQGAYVVAVDPESRMLVTNSLTEEKVNKKWQAINPLHKRAMRTVHDPVDKRILFMYDTSASPTARTWNYQEVLVYDLRLNAWYPLNFPASTAFATATSVKAFVKPDIYTRDGDAIIKYLTYTSGSGLRWTEMTGSDFSDLSEVDAAGYLLTGFEHMGDASRDMQAESVTTFMERNEDSSLKMSFRWDFAESSVTGKHSPKVECYRPPRFMAGGIGDDGYPVVFVRHTIPGQGLVAQVRFETTPGAEAVLYGWSVAWLGMQ